MKVKHIKGGGDVEVFNNEFPNHKMVVAGFFSSLCGHCKAFKPEWKKFTKEAKNSSLGGLVVTIPEEYMKDAKCDQSNFKGFPTVRIFQSGHFKDYEGKREAKALMDHIKTLVSGQRGGRKKKRRRRRIRRVTKRHRGRRRRRSRRRTKRRR